VDYDTYPRTVSRHRQEPPLSDPTRSVDVSVIVPVYNAMPYLHEFLESLAGQDLSDEAYEVIAVDDGSTDGSAAALDAFGARHPNVRVFHQENSGWPGKPRNRGLDLARGRYVFFADADDRLGTEALRRLVAFADEHGSDVVVPKMVGLNGRMAWWPHPEQAPDADLEKVLQTLTPQKLIRRSMLVDRDLRFPEEKIRLEDGMMLTRAYYTADRVSALGDYDYYYIRTRDDGGNISSGRLDPPTYTWSVGEVSRLIKEHDPDPARADRIVLDLYRRKCLKMYRPDRFAEMQDVHRDQWLHEHAKYIATYIPPELEAGLRPPFRQRSERVRAGDKQGLLTLGKIEEGQAVTTLIRGRWSLLSLRLEFRVELQPPEAGRADLFLQLQDRDSENCSEIPVAYGGSGDAAGADQVLAGLTTIVTCVAKVPRSLLKGRQGTVDLFVRRVLDDGSSVRSRVQSSAAAELPRPQRRVRLYETIKGNVSIKLQP
jgi:glycosyltransferase involved in cell wall biosynthesis